MGIIIFSALKYLYLFAQCCRAVVSKVTLVPTLRAKVSGYYPIWVCESKHDKKPSATNMVLFRETTLNEFALMPKVTFSLVFVSMNKSQTQTQLPEPLV